MFILNYAHPLTAGQKEQLAKLTNEELIVVTIPVNIDNTKPLRNQITAIVEASLLDSYKGNFIMVNLPGLSIAAVSLYVELYNSLGYYPNIMRLRPVFDSTPRVYEVAEIVKL